MEQSCINSRVPIDPAFVILRGLTLWSLVRIRKM